MLNELDQQDKQKAELEMINRATENPALKTFIRGLSPVLVGLGIKTYARLFFN
jgi:hypothetical protein